MKVLRSVNSVAQASIAPFHSKQAKAVSKGIGKFIHLGVCKPTDPFEPLNQSVGRLVGLVVEVMHMYPDTESQGYMSNPV